MTRLLPLCLTLLACAVHAQEPAAPAAATRPESEGPQGSVSEATAVFVFGPAGWTGGRPGDAPWQTVDGPFELRGLPRAQPTRATSVFFTRPGHFPVHRVLRPEAPRPPSWGPLFFDPLLGGKAGLLVLVVEHDPGGVVRYLRHSVRVIPRDAGQPKEVVAAGERGVRLNLEPGRYRLELDTDRRFPDAKAHPRELSVRADQALPLVFALDAPGPPVLPLKVEPPRDPRLRPDLR
ncbi:MAG: hypothetical protein R3F62_20205 [Planctomycetota bacterium]